MTATTGHDSRTFLLAHWALQLHLLLPTRAYAPTLETTLCDLERLRELADFFSLRDVADEIQDLADRLAAGSGGLTPFASVSGGFANLQDLTTVTLRAIGERMEMLGGASFREAVTTEVELLETLASEELVGRYILDASQDRIRCCVCLATMVMVIRELLRMGETGSTTAETADAQRLAQLGELVGITPVNTRRNPLPKIPSGADREKTDTETPAAADPQPDGGRDAGLFPDSEPAEPIKRQPATEPEDEGDLTVDVASRHLPEPPPPEPEWEPEPLQEDGTKGVEPDTEPDMVDARDAPAEPDTEDPDAEIAEALAETEAPGQGLGQMLLMVLMVLVGVGIVALVVVRPAWLDNLTSQGGIEGVQAITPEPEESVATAVPTATEIPAQAVEEPAEPTPVPPTPTSTPVPGYVFLATTAQVYLWPNVAAETLESAAGGGQRRDSGQAGGGRRPDLAADGGHVLHPGRDRGQSGGGGSAAVDRQGGHLPTFRSSTSKRRHRRTSRQPTRVIRTRWSRHPNRYPTTGPSSWKMSTCASAPATISIPRGILPAGREVNLLGTSADGSWSFMDDFHWILSAAIANIPDGLPVLRHPTTISNANLRAAPDSGSARQGFLGPGTALLLDGWTLGSNPDGVWYHLDTGEWIYGDLVQDAYANLPERPYVPDEQ